MPSCKSWIFFLFIFLTATSSWRCNEEDSLLPDATPHIEVSAISDSEITQYQEALVVTLFYEDGDGDLGFPDPDINALTVQDSRLLEPDEIYVPPQAPVDSKVAIKGTLLVEIPGVFLLGNGDTETAIFSLQIIDRAGNLSNVVQTPEITIIRE